MIIVRGNSGLHLAGENIHIERAAGRVNHRRAHHAFFRNDIEVARARMVTLAKFGRRRIRGNAEVGFPEQPAVCITVAVRVERIDRIMHGGDEEHIAHAFAGNGQVRQDQRLRINVAIHRVAEQLAEAGHVDVGGRQQRFPGIQALAGVVVVVGQDGSFLRAGQCGESLGRAAPRQAGRVGDGNRKIIWCAGGQSADLNHDGTGLRAGGKLVRPGGRVGAAIAGTVINPGGRIFVAGVQHLAVDGGKGGGNSGRRLVCDRRQCGRGGGKT